jgi:hypothetical protein
MGGVGFRYLLARKFKLRVGIDVAHSTGTWAYYIIFGLYYFCQQLAKVNYSYLLYTNPHAEKLLLQHLT